MELKRRYTLFSKIQDGTAFSPAPGEIGATKVFIKKPNGVCPQVGVEEEYGIFYPTDKVVATSVPPHFLKKYV